MKKLIYSMIIVILIGITACATVPLPPEVQKQETTFRMPKEKDGEVWGRAIAYVAKNSGMKISMQTDNLIETFNPTDRLKTGFRIIKIVYGDEVEYVVVASGILMTYDYERDAKLCAYYMRTGKMLDK